MINSWLSSVWKQIWITGVVALVLLALYTSLGRQLMPSIEVLKPDIEKKLSEQLQTPVVIDKLMGSWGWFAPVVTLQGVRIGEELEQLSLEYLSAEVDMSGSAFYRTIVFKNIDINGVSLQLSEKEDKQWYLGQWLLTEEGEASENKPLWLSLLEVQQEINFQNSYITFYPHQKKIRRMKVEQIRLRNLRDQHWLDGQITLPGKDNTRLSVQMEMEGDVWDWESVDINGYAFIPNQDWLTWINFFTDDISPKFTLSKLNAGAEAWFKVNNGQLQQLDAQINIPEFELETRSDKEGEVGKQLSLSGTDLQIYSKKYQGDWHSWYQLSQNEMNTQGIRALFPLIGAFSWMPTIDDQAFHFALKQADLKTVANLIIENDILAERHEKYVRNLDPTGLAKNIELFLLTPSEARESSEFVVSLQAEEATTEAWRGIPSVREASAAVMFNASAGRVEVMGDDLKIHVDDFYPQAWQFKNVDAEVFWQIEPEYARVLSTRMKAGYETGVLNGNFSLSLPMDDWKESDWDPQLQLQFGFTDMDVRWHKQFVPQEIIGEETAKWLDEGLKQGAVKQGVFLLVNDLQKDSHVNASTVQFYLDVDNAELKYLAGWPALRNIKARAMMINKNLDAWLHSAETLGGSLVADTGRIKLRADKNNEVVLTVDGQMVGDTHGGLQYFQQTPLKDVVSDAFSDWDAAGEMKAKLHLVMPLSKQGAQPKVFLDSEFNNTNIYVEGLNLRADNIVGNIKYSSDSGVESEGISGRIFGGVFDAKIHSDVIDQGLDIFIEADGQATMDAVKEWNSMFVMKPVSGDFAYQAEMAIKPIRRGGLQLDLTSDLKGIQIQTPEPFKKSVVDKKQFNINIQKKRDTRLSFQYQYDKSRPDREVNAVFAMGKDGVSHGQVYFGQSQAFLPSESGIKVRGKFNDDIDGMAWWELWQSIKPESTLPQVGDVAQQSGANQLNAVDVRIENVHAFGNRMGVTHVKGKYRWQQWFLNIDSELMKGDVVFSDDNSPIQLDLEYLHFPPSESDLPVAEGEEEVDNFVDLNPYLIPELDMKVQEIFASTVNHGRWDISLRQNIDDFNNPYTLIKINDADSKASYVNGDVWWRFSNDRHVTEIKNMRINSYDLAATQKAFRQPVAVESKKSRFIADLNWQGTPLFFNFKTLSGQVDIKIKDGVFVNENAGAINAFGVLNVDSITRRLKLDFSDLYQEGVAFDIMKSKVDIRNGLMTFKEPLWVDGPSAKFQLSGTTNLVTGDLDQKLIVTFPITSSLPLVAVLAGFTPQVAGAIYITEKLIGEELEKFSSASYTLKGNWSDPKLKIDQAFDNEVDGQESRGLGDRILDIFGLGDD